MCKKKKKKQKIADRIAVKPFLTPLFFVFEFFRVFNQSPSDRHNLRVKVVPKKGVKGGR